MNALVTDQERRIAKLLSDPETAAAGVRAGVWIGDDQSVGTRSAMTDPQLICDPAALMDDPPDILLTNYKMLDRLLTTPARQRLWAANTPPDPRGGWEQPLTYLVLDEFHTYDGAQGTDVAMLLRRLGHRWALRRRSPHSPGSRRSERRRRWARRPARRGRCSSSRARCSAWRSTRRRSSGSSAGRSRRCAPTSTSPCPRRTRRPSRR